MRIAVSLLCLLLTLGIAQAQSWNQLGDGLSDGTYVQVNDMIEWNGQLIVTGFFSTADGETVNGIAAWDGTSWTGLAGGFNGYAAGAVLDIYQGNLVAGGAFMTAGGQVIEGLAMWDGTTWSSIGDVMDANIYGIYVDGDNLYVCGGIEEIGGVEMPNAAVWDGSTWTGLGLLGADRISGGLQDIIVIDGDIYVAGMLEVQSSGLHDGIARLDGDTWTGLGAGGSSCAVMKLKYVNDTLWAVGDNVFGDGNKVAYKDSESGEWITPDYEFDAMVFDICYDNGIYYFGGEFVNANGLEVNCITAFDGTNWSTFGGGFLEGPYGTSVRRIYNYDGAIYVGGQWTYADGNEYLGIVRMGGDSDVETQNPLPEKYSLLSSYPNPFNSFTTISYSVPESGNVAINVFDINGRLVSTLHEANMQAGNYEISYDAASLASGIYFVRLNLDGITQSSHKMVLLK